MTFYFYDLETSGINPRTGRIMQFGGQRTDMSLKPIGEADNFLIKLAADVLPEPDAILTHGITPQKTQINGISEAEFLKYFSSEISQPDTIMAGFNNIRFDDEFMRFTLWRNFYDAYEWQWKNNCSKWDLLDVVRMTRALRPAGIKWPYAPDGKASNRLEFLSSVNKLTHSLAHDALSDVKAVIALARLIKSKQPKLFNYLLSVRKKTNVQVLLGAGKAVVYTSGRYPSEFHKTTVAIKLVAHPDNRGAFMYDLRADPTPYLKMTPAELAVAWQFRPPHIVRGSTSHKEKDVVQFPLKLMAYNRAPAVAPLVVLDKASAKNIKIDMNQVLKNQEKLKSSKDFAKKILQAYELLQPAAQPKLIFDEQQVDSQLYDGFIPDHDKVTMSMVRAAPLEDLPTIDAGFSDERLQLLFPLYKARNFPKILNDQEQVWWENFRTHKLLDGGEASQAASYFKRIAELKTQKHITKDQHFLLEELELYGQSVLPLV